jgi:hypothetical protein
MVTTVESLTSPFNYMQTIIDLSKYVKLSKEVKTMMMKKMNICTDDCLYIKYQHLVKALPYSLIP